MNTTDRTETLDDLRRDIDRIDAAMHALLIERGEIIDRLIAVKKTTERGSAFRPKREADMMRDLLSRHSGRLPLDTVESIWRVIISTFTWVQAPYRVHGPASPDASIRDVARFHFGFTVPYLEHGDASEVIRAVAEDDRDLALVPVASPGAWWRHLTWKGGPQVIARLPFVERSGHPAGLPVFLVAAPPAPGAAAEDFRLLTAEAEGWRDEADATVAALRGEVTGRVGSSFLFTLPQEVTIEQFALALAPQGVVLTEPAWIGGHAARHRLHEPS